LKIYVFKSAKVKLKPQGARAESDPAQKKVGFIFPGGNAPLFLLVLMFAVPATIAGRKEIALCSPPNKKILTGCFGMLLSCVGVTKISLVLVAEFSLFAGLTFGTETIP
jgi:histidinol dehydrogenase